MTLGAQNIRGFVYNQRTRDQILTSIYSMIKERIQTVREKTQSNEKLYSRRILYLLSLICL